MKRTLASFLAASSLALGVAAPAALAQRAEPAGFHQMRGGHGMHGDHGPQRLLRRLDLTQEQRDQAFRIFHDRAPALREQMKVVHSARAALRQAALAPNFDRAQARALADAEGKAIADLALMRAEAMSRVVALLTPEQLEKLQQSRRR